MRNKILLTASAIIVIILAGFNFYKSTGKTKVQLDTNTKIGAPSIATSSLQNANNEYGGIDTNIVEHKEIDSDNRVVGYYGTTNYDASKTTDEDIVKFFNNVIKKSNNNYFTLIDGKNSIQFIGCSDLDLHKGSISDSKRDIIAKPEYYGQISGNTIKWVKIN